ncbi:MAG: alpha-ketoacid dehydrogenase subunit beta [Dehalococcoidia bacterium]|nr:alpha-ketoacid dehydrogenase subunit beta [Dehalococcoidia bacterium]MDW8120098.1 alpha-ketoacid dehydrogenase subunit beta [Chloroflexota bacterium]
MPDLTLREAIRKGLQEALDNDPRVFIMGEDVGAYGGAYAVTKGFLRQYGPERIRDTPISESVIVGAGVGAAMGGMRPIVEIMTINFSLLAMDQIVNHAAKLRYMSGGQLMVPLLIRTVTGGGAGLAATHSQSLEGWYASVPGLKVVFPSTPADALGLLRTCLKDPNTIIYCEHALLYGVRGPVPDTYYEVPLGRAEVKRPGTDVTLISYGRGVHLCLQAATELARRGVQAEVIDLRSLRPLDLETPLASLRKTHRALIVEEAWPMAGIGPYLGLRLHQEAFDDLDAPIAHLCGADTPAPYARNLERLSLPDVPAILKTVAEAFGL